MDWNRAIRWVPIAILIAVGMGYLWEIVTLSGIPVARDMQMFFVPQKRLLWEAFQAREVPLWTPYIGTGAPFLANIQSGFFYPPHWLYALLPFYAAFNFLIVFHFALGGTFAFLLCRRLGLVPAAAYVGAATWMLGGYFASLLNLVNALQAAAWVPGIAWAALRVFEYGTRGSVALLVLIGVCAALAGEPQSVLLSIICGSLVVGLWSRRTRPSGTRLLAGAAACAVAALFILGLLMAQALPTLEFLRESGRGVGLSLEQAAAFDLKPIRLIYLIVPSDFRDPEYAFGLRSIIGRGDPWLFSIYLGALFPILFVLAWRGQRRLEVAMWTGAAILAVIVGLGDHTPVFPWLFRHVPGMGAFRFPEKYFLVTAFAAFLLAAYGTEEALTRRRHRGDRVLALAYVALPVGVLGFLYTNLDAVRRWALGFGNSRMAADFDFALGLWHQNLLKLALLATLGSVLLWLYRRRRISPRWFGVLLGALVTGDLVVAHRHLNPVVSAEFYETQPEIFRHVPIHEVQRDYRYRSSRFDSLSGTLPVLALVPFEPQKWFWQQIVGPNVGQPWHILQQDAWDAIKLSRTEDERDLHRVLEPERRWKLLRLQSVRYVHSLLPLEADGQARELPLDTLAGHLYELVDPLPRAYVVPEASWTRDPVEAINLALDPGFDLRSRVVITDSAWSGRGFDGAAGVDADVEDPSVTDPVTSRAVDASSVEGLPFPGATIIESTPSRVRIRLADGVTGYAVLTDSYYPGWRAAVDGQPREIQLANYFFRAVEIGPGDREVVFTYESRAFRLGLLLSLGSLLVGLALWSVMAVRARRARPPQR